jgi:tetratricopeptide (TPR) repeat protein
MRIVGYRYGVRTLHHLGRHDAAIRLERVADADTRRSGGGARLAYLESSYSQHASLLREAGVDTALTAHTRAVMTASDSESGSLVEEADLLTATKFRIRRAEQLLDNGELVASLREWEALARLADSLGVSDLQAHVRVRRGRTLVKLGRRAEAELALVAGREAARRANHLLWQYEAEHNLLHLYEAIPGRDEEARRAGESFAALTQLGGLAPVQLIAHHDLAWFHLRRGERERARAQFEAVVACADSLPGYEYWAGEYFELIGDLDRAENTAGRRRGRCARRRGIGPLGGSDGGRGPCGAIRAGVRPVQGKRPSAGVRADPAGVAGAAGPCGGSDHGVGARATGGKPPGAGRGLGHTLDGGG